MEEMNNRVDYVRVSQGTRDMSANRKPVTSIHGFTGTPWLVVQKTGRNARGKISITAQVTPKYRGRIAVMCDTSPIHRHQDCSLSEMRINAVLMSSAPKLLAACEEALKELSPDSKAAQIIKVAIANALSKGGA